MGQKEWTAVDHYITGLFVGRDPALDATLRACAKEGFPPISVSPPQGKLLTILARLQGARDILEIGTLGGYSTICLARGLQAGGHLITLEINPEHARVALANIAEAGLNDRVELRLGPALDSLASLAAGGGKRFDLIFIDADKVNNPKYFAWALKLSHKGTLIIVDNVVRKGTVLDASSKDQSTLGSRRFNRMAASEPRVIVTEIQTVGVKGYDGFALALVVAE